MDTRLSSSITISKYNKMVENQDRVGISRFIQERFSERYIIPVKSDARVKHGFTIMAVSCLMIEALESFYNGWPTSNGKGRKVFKGYFKRFPQYEISESLASEFYTHVRCGILHQAETTGGWRIRRVGPLLVQESRTINASKFIDQVERSLVTYCNMLETDDWNSDLWKKHRKKMDSIIANCTRHH